MNRTTESIVKPSPRNRRVAGADPGKRRQILDGALAVFMVQGFDAASMNDIAAAASVSKGTLYVYFEDKEHLFVALIEREREIQKRSAFDALEEEPDLVHALTQFGERLLRLLVNPFALSAQRVVVGVAERMPDLGREFYQNGPMQGAKRITGYLDRQVASGQLAIEDTALAAVQFLDLCQSTMLRPRLFNAVREPPSDAEITRVVASAVAMFLARYGVKPVSSRG